MGRFQMAVTPEGINIFQVGIFYLKVDELTVLLTPKTKYFGQECALHRTQKKRAFFILPGRVQIAITPEEVNIFQICLF